MRRFALIPNLLPPTPEAPKTEKMTCKISTTLLLACLMAGCTDREPAEERDAASPQSPPAESLTAAETRTVEGVLKHFPSDVKSVESWYGHTFKVGSTPIISTETIPEETLRKFVGSEVVITGTWDSGKEWSPSEEQQALSMPIDGGSEAVVRGEGLRASSVSLLEEPQPQKPPVPR